MLLRETVAGSATPSRHHDMTMYTGDGSREAGGEGGAALTIAVGDAVVGAAGAVPAVAGVSAGVLCSKIRAVTGATDAWDTGTSRVPGSTSMAKRPSPKQSQNNLGIMWVGISSLAPIALVPMGLGAGELASWRAGELAAAPRRGGA